MKKILSLFLALLVLTGVGCENKIKPTTGKPEVQTTVSTSTVIQISPTASTTLSSSTSNSAVFATSSIDINNIGTWPRFSFKELGFSIRAPFTKSKMSAIFHDCTQSMDRCDGYENGKDVNNGSANDNMYWFGGRLGSIDISSYSKNYESGGESGLQIYDLVKIGNDYFIVSSGINGYKWRIHPLEIYSNFKTPIIYFDGYQDYFRIKEESYGEKTDGQYYGAVFKLPGSKNFKAAVLFFNEKDLSQSQFISILKTIRFAE